MEQVVRLKERFLAHEMDGILGRLYQDPKAQVDRYVRALDAYAQIYDGDEEVFCFHRLLVVSWLGCIRIFRMGGSLLLRSIWIRSRS